MGYEELYMVPKIIYDKYKKISNSQELSELLKLNKESRVSKCEENNATIQNNMDQLTDDLNTTLTKYKELEQQMKKNKARKK